MTIAKRLANAFAAIAFVATTASAAHAIDVGQTGCPGSDCEIVAAAAVDADPWGGMVITDEKGRAWSLVSFQHGPLVAVGAPVEWSDGFAVIAARDRYDEALARGEQLAVRTSADRRHHLCVSGETMTCIYLPVE